MKAFIFLFASLLLFQGCQKEQEEKRFPASLDKELKAEPFTNGEQDKVSICHRTESGSYIPIEVSQSALPAHLQHGDNESDGDNDGYTAVGACIGSADDCDDANPEVHPGAAEICSDNLDNNCNGAVEENCCVVPSELIGFWQGLILTIDKSRREEIILDITSESINVFYPRSGCRGVWDIIDCSHSGTGLFHLRETITDGSCTPIECVIVAQYRPGAPFPQSIIEFFNAAGDDCMPSSFFTGTVFRR